MKNARHTRTAKDKRKEEAQIENNEKKGIHWEKTERVTIALNDDCRLFRGLPLELMQLIRDQLLEIFIDCRDVVRFHMTNAGFYSAYIGSKVSELNLICSSAKKRNAALYKKRPDASYCLNISMLSEMMKHLRMRDETVERMRTLDVEAYVDLSSLYRR